MSAFVGRCKILDGGNCVEHEMLLTEAMFALRVLFTTVRLVTDHRRRSATKLGGVTVQTAHGMDRPLILSIERQGILTLWTRETGKPV